MDPKTLHPKFCTLLVICFFRGDILQGAPKMVSMKNFTSGLFITSIYSFLISLGSVDLYVLFDISVFIHTCLNEI